MSSESWDHYAYTALIVFCFLMRDGKILLIRRANEPYKGEITVPGGRKKRGESLREACVREMKEETGYTAEHIGLLMKMHTTIGFCTEVIYIYEASGLTEGETNFDEGEFIEIIKIPLEEAVNLIFSGGITDGKTIAALLAYGRK